MTLELSTADQKRLDGESGEGLALAMRILVAVATTMEAPRLLDITGAHIDGCLYHGRVGLDFVERLSRGGATVRVPTTLNVSSLDLLHPELYRGDVVAARESRRMMQAYEDLGCRPTWTCAPYQLEERPPFGAQIAWAESNAIVFANSVLGARTHRYGDFIDICAALTGRAPAAGLHMTANRRGQVVFDVSAVNAELLAADVVFPVLGHLIGGAVGRRVPVIVGLPGATEDQLKALGAAAASAGSVGLFHAIGITPEAPDMATALQGRDPEATVSVNGEMLRAARDSLTTASGTALAAISVGTPHASLKEMEGLARLFAGRSVAPSIEAYVSTGRDIAAAAAAAGIVDSLAVAGVTTVTDTCTYVTPILRSFGPVMTDSGKWAYYAPGNLGVDVIFGSMSEVVESAVAGRVVRDDTLWA